MRKIKVESITISGFKSFREETTIEFGEQNGLIFLGGSNLLEPRLGANGAGKSSLWDALIWCFYGKTARGNTASEIVSWGVKRPCVGVTAAFGDERYLIERQGNPNSVTMESLDYEEEDVLTVKQEDIDQFLGMTYRRFLQSVIFGQAVPLFLDLSIPQRGELLDEVMDLALWMRLSDRASKRANILRSDAQIEERNIGKLTGEWNGLDNIEALQADHDEWEAQHAKRIEMLLADVEMATVQLEDANNDLRKVGAFGTDLEREKGLLEAEQKEMQQTVARHALRMQRARDKIRDLEEERQFFGSHLKTGDCSCPTCKQPMTAKMLQKNVDRVMGALSAEELSLDAAKRDHDQAQKRFSEKRVSYDKLLEKERGLISRRAELREIAKRFEAYIERDAKEIEKLSAEKNNPYADRLEKVRRRSEQITAELAELNAKKLALEGQANYADFWKAHFKRVRLFLIERVLATFEIETANAASVLGLPDWKIKFATEVENKSGGMKAGIQVLVQSPLATAPWEVWSGGEGQRIKLAVSLGMSSMIQRAAGVDFRFEVFDEPSAWLSPEGIEDLLECLQYRAQVTGKAIWVIDPRGFSFGGFSEEWLAIKDENGTRVERINKELA